MICPFIQESNSSWINCKEGECALWTYDERGHGLCAFTSIGYSLAAMREMQKVEEERKELKRIKI